MLIESNILKSTSNFKYEQKLNYYEPSDINKTNINLKSFSLMKKMFIGLRVQNFTMFSLKKIVIN